MFSGRRWRDTGVRVQGSAEQTACHHTYNRGPVLVEGTLAPRVPILQGVACMRRQKSKRVETDHVAFLGCAAAVTTDSF